MWSIRCMPALEIVAMHGCHPPYGMATYGDSYQLTYVRGPSGIIVMLAEELEKSCPGSINPRPLAGQSGHWNGVMVPHDPGGWTRHWRR